MPLKLFRKGGEEMKKKKWLITFIIMMFIALSNVAYAEHEVTGMKDKTPPKGYNQLNEEEKKKADELKDKLNKIWGEYAAEVAAEAEKKLAKMRYPTPQQTYKEVLKALKSKEGKYFGELNNYNDGLFGEVAAEAWKYGIRVHFPRKDGGAFSDLCDDDDDIIDTGFTDCEGAPEAITKKGLNYDYKTNKLAYAQTRLTIDEVKREGKLEDEGKKIAIASPGMFTQSDVRNFGKCKVGEEKENLKKQLKEPSIGSKKTDDKKEGPKPPIDIGGAVDKVGEEMTETFKKFTNDFDTYMFAVNCDGDSLSIISQFLNISRPLNITDNQYIMRLVYIAQEIAFTMSIVIIAFFALMYTTGFQNMDPVKFAIRLFFCILAVTYLPWLMQDVLNLNNVVVYNISSLEFANGNTTEIIMGAFSALWDSLASNDGILSSLLLLILVFIMAVLAIAPMLRVVMWWYVRLLRIFLGAIVGPILVMLAALPQTENTAKAWLTKYVGQVFQQVFMAFALVMIAVIVGNIEGFGKTINIGWFGQAMLIYSSIYFLAEVPSFAGDFLSSFSGGSSEKMASGVYGLGKKYGKKTVSGAKGAVVGAAAGAYGMKRGLMGNKGFGGGVGGYFGKKLMNNKHAKFGKALGTTTRNSAKNATTGFKAGINGEGGKDVKGISGAAGLIAGAGTIAAAKGAGAATRGAKKAGQKVAEAAKNKMDSTMEEAYKKSGSVPFNSDFVQAFNDTMGGGSGDSDSPKVDILTQDENGNWVDENGEKVNKKLKDKWTVGGEDAAGVNGSFKYNSNPFQNTNKTQSDKWQAKSEGGADVNGSFKYGSSSPLQRKGSGGNGSGENKGGGTPTLSGPQYNAPKLEYTPDVNKNDDGGGGGGKGNNPPPHNPMPNSGGKKPPSGSSGKDDGDNPPNPPSPMSPVQYGGTYNTDSGGDYSNYKSNGADDSSGDSHGGGTSYHRSSKEDRGSVDDAGDSHTPSSPIQYSGSSHTEDFTESHSTYTRASDSDDSDSRPYHQSSSKERSSVDREETGSHSSTPSNPLHHSGSDYSGTTTGTYTGNGGREEVIEVEIYEPSSYERTSPRTTERENSSPDTPSATYVNDRGETEVVEVEIVEEPRYSQKFDRSSRKTSGNSSQVRPTPRTKPSAPSAKNQKGKPNKKDDPNDKKRK